MLAFILSRLFVHTVLISIFGVVSGSIVGVIAGAIRRSIPNTLTVSIMGASLGCALVCITPPISSPGSLETWGMGGGLGSLQVLMMLILIALGGLVGSLVASTFGFRYFCRIKPKYFKWIMAGVYILMVISLAYGYRQYCSPSISYC